MYLYPRDLDVLNRAILAIHSHPDLDELHRALPAIVLAAIPADYFRLLQGPIDTRMVPLRNFRHWESHPRIDATMQKQFMRWMPVHPFANAPRPVGGAGALTLADFYTARQLRETPLYREMYRPVEIGRLMSSSFGAGDLLVTMSLARPPGSTDFSERDRTMLSILRPHFERARRNAMAFERVASTACRAATFTSRETQVAYWLSQGKTNQEIGAILAMRPRTAEKHVEHIFDKLGVVNRTAASLALAVAPGDREE